MRTAEEIIKMYCEVFNDISGKNIDTTLENVVKAVNEARKDVILECANRVKVTDPYQEGRKSGLRDDNLENYIKHNPAKINKESILNLIKELK